MDIHTPGKEVPMAHMPSMEEAYGAPVEPHTHIDRKGVFHQCYHECKQVVTQYGFWIGVTISFPIEHFIWTKLPGFSYISKLMGLTD